MHTLSNATIPHPVHGTSFTHDLSVTGVPTGTAVTWALVSGSLPPGMSLSTDGKLTGSPTAAGTYNARISATAGTDVVEENITVVVDPTPVVTPPVVVPPPRPAAAAPRAQSNWTGPVIVVLVIAALALLGFLGWTWWQRNRAAPAPTPTPVDVAATVQAAVATAMAGQPTMMPPAATAQPTSAPQNTQPPAATSAPQNTQQAPASAASLNYDESNGDPLTVGQSQLIALYLRLTAPISQGNLEAAVAQIQAEAAAAQATVFEGDTLTLDQRQAWLLWCSDGTQVDPPADVSLVHEVTLLDSTTMGRIWIQVPFAEGVPLRTDDTWVGCNGKFWAVAVH